MCDDSKKTQILSIRQHGEAWDQPFAFVFESTADGKPTVASVRHISVAGKVVGVEVKSTVRDHIITDVILENDKAGKLTLPELRIELEGRFAILRTEQNGATRRTSLYLGAGERLRFGEHEIQGGSKDIAYRAYNVE